MPLYNVFDRGKNMTGKCKSFLAGPFLISGVRACLFYTADDFIDVGYFVLDKVGLNALQEYPGLHRG